MWDDEHSIDRIYEAASLPELWPTLLQSIASAHAAKGALLLTNGGAGVRWAGSPGIAGLMDAFLAGGWMEHNTRVTRLLAAPPHPGFRTDLDFHSADEIATFPIYREFLSPNGLAAGAATLIQGAGDDALMLTLEGFEDHDGARAALPALDALRPHLARAATLSARIAMARMQAGLAALELVGTPAAMIGRNGRIQDANSSFDRMVPRHIFEGASRRSPTEATAHRSLERALTDATHGRGQSLPLRLPQQNRPAALHLVPVRGAARDVFVNTAVIAILAQPDNRSVPGADLLQSLFDLTPAEAGIARHLAEGASVSGMAAAGGISVGTVRTHLKSVFLKTGVDRQSALVAMLLGLGRASTG